MSNLAADGDRTRMQCDRMRALDDGGTRQQFQQWFADRRSAVVIEPDGLVRVPLAVVGQRDAHGVVVTADELVVPAPAERAATEALDREAVRTRVARRVGARCCLQVEAAAELSAVRDLLRHRDVPTAYEHVAAYAGRSKGGNTPELADARPVPPRRDGGGPDGPLVVVVDTGLDRHAGARSDGWLEGVVPLDASCDVDLLDTVDAAGNLVRDGLLDLAAGHGTFVAGLVRRQAPDASVVVLRALDTDGFGSESALTTAIHRAGEVFARHGGRGVLNLSLGLEVADDEDPPEWLGAALDDLPPAVHVVAAAGNGNTGRPVWPAAFDRVIAVASVSSTEGGLSGSQWSNRGDWVRFSALGEGRVSTFVEGQETPGTGDPGDPFDEHPDTFRGPDPCALWSGTSFSTATVAGALARLMADGAPDPVGALEGEAERTIDDFGHALPY